jgi:hypothetical protein
LDGETLDILVNELSDRLHHSNKKQRWWIYKNK